MHFLLTPSAVTSQAVAAAGADAVTIDLEHGPIDFKDAQAMIASVMGTHTLPMIRVPSIDPVSVKRSLDLGAEGIVFPLARNAADVSRAVSTLHYPPRGERGFGPFIAHSAHRFEIGSTISYYEKNPPICCILVETVEAVQNIDEIADVDGVDIFQIAQFDLSTSLGVPGQFDHPTFLNAERKVEEAILRRGKPLGAVALTHARAQELRARGYSMLVGFDVHWLKSSIQTAQTWVLPAQ
ncbi:hypothetical protein AB1Y20_000627 [Prymnesium parvum]|uniref:HpcH/HpaI aldolase/citrate lyase domain-containing protein n=1 Tax=Prymnesium parvum TaxID=97485 RepID=A0AB34K8W0_PRYPA